MYYAYLIFWVKLTLAITRPYIIGITGSVGKTTTTEMLATVLTSNRVKQIIGEVGYTKDNLNNDIGLPAAILLYDRWESVPMSRWSKLWMMVRIPFRVMFILARYPKYLILEYGVGSYGHMSHLLGIAQPKIGVLTTVGPAHLNRFKTIRGVAEEKRILLQALPDSGLALIGEDHEFVSFVKQGVKANIVTFPGKGVELSKSITLAICDFLEIPEEMSRQEILNFVPPKGRLNCIKSGGMTIIDDSFNANPLSMKHGLNMLQQSVETGRKIAILGYMANLGEQEIEYHQDVGQYAHSVANLVIGVGDIAKYYEPDILFVDSEICAKKIKDLLLPDDVVLIKGSIQSNMWYVVESINS